MHQPKDRHSQTKAFHECYFAKLKKSRANIYGIAKLKSRLPTFLPRPKSFPSHVCSRLPYLPRETAALLDEPMEHAILAFNQEVRCLVAGEGYWNSAIVHLKKGDDVEFISIDAFERTIIRPALDDGTESFQQKTNLILAITTAKQILQGHAEGDCHYEYALRIYGATSKPNAYFEEALFNLEDSMAVIPINYTPMQLAHATVRHSGMSQIALLLSGRDGRVHMFLEDESTNQFREHDIANYFPFLAKFKEVPSSILCFDIYEKYNTQIITAGCQDGSVHLAVYTRSSERDNFCTETATHTIKTFGPVSSLNLFDPVTKLTSDASQVNLLVTFAIEEALIFHGVTINGLSKSVMLPQSTYHDSILCSHVLDFDYDGENEIFLGTYGRELLAYKRARGTSHKYSLLWKRTFAYPIYGITSLDLNLDGVDEVVVQTIFGVHIFQPNLENARSRLTDVLRYLEEVGKTKRELELRQVQGKIGEGKKEEEAVEEEASSV
ncbi:uncharacterized protein VTP21DRAFT_7334 [Calcarisporiella thermophila]|uniref:uncharacterized protein n=1 Tax=Calcarisporiella thermophila TaxID=911321 RepID=UPI003742676A